MPSVAASEPVGRRVVVRRALPGDPSSPRYSDVVGVLVDAGPDALAVRRRDGTVVTVPRPAVHTLKAVPASPADVLALEEVTALGWPAPDTRWLGRWLLRAAEGWTGRANSALPLGDPGLPLEEALAETVGWYGARGLRARVVVPLPGREALDAALGERGWSTYNPVRVLTADVEVALRGLPERADLPPVTVTPELSADWLAAYHFRGEAEIPPVAPAVLTGAAQPGFAAIRVDGRAVAIARASVERGWLGVTAVEVDPAHRRRGLAGQVMRGVLRWGAERGATGAYLQVAEENVPALALYDRLGFTEHHRYHYRLAPG
jgi:ribosomal protein S18 acetylase RimI-like enzyme